MKNAYWPAAFFLTSIFSPVLAQTVVKRPVFESQGSDRGWYLEDSRYGYIAKINVALADRLATCDEDAEAIPQLRIASQRFGEASAAALKSARACAGIPTTPAAGMIDEAGFRKLLPEAAMPSLFDRMRPLAFGASPLTPDYDVSFWDLDSAQVRRSGDPASLFSWGPFRATAGHGRTLQSLLRRLNRDAGTKSELETAFSDIPDVLALLLAPASEAQTSAMFADLAADPYRRQHLQIALATVSDSEAVRQAYHAYFYGPDGIRLGWIADYVAIWRKAGRDITEVDLAFFLERSLQFPRLAPDKIDEVASALRPLSKAPAWRARLEVSRRLTFSAQGPRDYQRGRDAIYFVDAPADALTPAEHEAWSTHSRIRASDTGLADRPADPCEIFALPQCTGKGD